MTFNASSLGQQQDSPAADTPVADNLEADILVAAHIQAGGASRSLEVEAWRTPVAVVSQAVAA